MDPLIRENNISVAALWSGLGQTVAQVITFSLSIVLARLLQPQDFGILAGASIFTTVASMLASLGVQQVILRERDLNEAFLSAALALTIIAGAAFASGTVLLAPVFGGVVQSADTIAALQILPLSIFTNSVGGFARAILVREIRQRDIAIAEVRGMIIYALACLLLALGGAGFWTLVVGAVLSSSTTALFYWLGLGRLIWPKLHWAQIRNILPLGSQVAVSDAIIWAVGLSPNLLVGRFLGVTSLGYYSFASNLAWLPNRKLFGVIDPLVQARLAEQIRTDSAVWSIYLLAIRYTSAVIWLPLCMLSVASYELTSIVYGAKWTPAVGPMNLLIGCAAVAALGGYSHGIYPVLGKPKLLIFISLLQGVLSVFFMTLFLPHGLIGVAAGYLVSNILLLLVDQILISRLLGGSIIDFCGSLIPAMLASIAAILLPAFTRQAVSQFLAPPTLLLLVLVISAVSYTTVLAVSSPQLFWDIVRRLLDALHGVFGSSFRAHFGSEPD